MQKNNFNIDIDELLKYALAHIYFTKVLRNDKDTITPLFMQLKGFSTIIDTINLLDNRSMFTFLKTHINPYRVIMRLAQKMRCNAYKSRQPSSKKFSNTYFPMKSESIFFSVINDEYAACELLLHDYWRKIQSNKHDEFYRRSVVLKWCEEVEFNSSDMKMYQDVWNTVANDKLFAYPCLLQESESYLKYFNLNPLERFLIIFIIDAFAIIEDSLNPLFSSFNKTLSSLSRRYSLCNLYRFQTYSHHIKNEILVYYKLIQDIFELNSDSEVRFLGENPKQAILDLMNILKENGSYTIPRSHEALVYYKLRLISEYL